MFKNYDLPEVIYVHRQSQPAQFPVWKTVKLGLASSVRNYLEQIKQNFQYNFYHDEVEEFRICRTLEVDLVKVTPIDLGLELPAKYPEVCAVARQRGLEICPQETGMALRLEYDNQPSGESLIVVSEPINGRLISVNNRPGLNWTRPQFWMSSTGYTLNPYQEYIFVRPRRT